VIDLTVNNNSYHVEFVHGEANDALVFDEEYCTYSQSNKHFYVKGSLGESGLLPNSDADSKPVRNYTLDYLKSCRVYYFHDTSATVAFKQAQKLSANTYLYSDAANLAPFLLFLREHYPASYQEIITAIQTVAPFFHDFYLQPQGRAGDESELVLHPAALEVLAEIIKATSKTTQVICSTQSLTFANHFAPEDFIMVD